jgi:molybdopterin converting factor small subunit
MNPTASPASGSSRLRVPIRVPGVLRELAGGRAEVVVAAGTVGEALDAMLEAHPGLRRHVRDEAGALRSHVNVFLNEDDIRYLGGEATPVAEGDTVTVVPSIAGG